MEIREVVLHDRLPQVPAGTLAFDLELANSFAKAPPVICMIGTEVYLAEAGHCVNRTATITRRDEEKALVEWFMEQITALAAENGHPRLLSFSGLENDLPWLQQRIERLHIHPLGENLLHRIDHVDLKREFYRRTHNEQISLKNLERIFGIERESAIQSKKVSFILTDIVRHDHREAAIPERLFQYLQEDVHNLMRIYNRWGEVSFEAFRLTEKDYLSQVMSLKNSVQRAIESLLRRKRASQRVVESLRRFLERLDRELDRALHAQTFVAFRLPAVPELPSGHAELERIQKKHRRLKSIALRDERTGGYLLRQQPERPKGALAVVLHEERLLMIRRSDRLKRAAGYWALPGGALEPEETPEQGALRELSEELGLSGLSEGVLGTSTSLSGEYTLYWVKVGVEDVADLRPARGEVTEVRWVAPGEAQELDPLIPGALEGFRRFLGPEWG